MEPLLNSVAVTTAGPLAPRTGWVTTFTFWILMSPDDVAALSGLTSSVCAFLSSACGERGDREHDGSGGEGAVSKAAAHGGGNSLNERTYGQGSGDAV